MHMSVIIPTLNEACLLGDTLALLRRNATARELEVIVADCGSADATVAIAHRGGVRVVRDEGITNRAQACNAGASAASGDVLLFLHADSRVPAGYDELIAGALDGDDVVGGAFEFKLAGPQWRLRVVELVNRVRYGSGCAYFGDQGLFVRRDAFGALGGFADMPILEDSDFSRRATRLGRMRLLRVAMITSARRFHAGGILVVLMSDALIWMWDMLGLDLRTFSERYRANNSRRGVAGAEHARGRWP